MEGADLLNNNTSRCGFPWVGVRIKAIMGGNAEALTLYLGFEVMGLVVVVADV